MTRVMWIGVLWVLLTPAAARAQERGRLGLTMGLPGSIGVLWNASERLGVRPEIDFAFVRTKTDDTLGGSTESKGSAIAFGGSALFYLTAPADQIRTYVTPRLTWGQERRDINGAETPALSRWNASGSLGAEYAPARRLSVYGEIGYGVARARTEGQGIEGSITTTSSSWGVRTGVGMVLYLGG